MRRFRVAERSMEPALVPGDEVVATTSLPPSRGDLVVFEHPRRRLFWMIKRVAEPPRPIPESHVWVESDNREAGPSDSRDFGPIPASETQTVVQRLDETTFREAVGLLTEEDEKLADAVDAHGEPAFWVRPAGLPTLVWLMLEQQVSLESGAATMRRVHELCGPITGESLASAGAAALARQGVTRQKAAYLVELGKDVAEGRLDVEALGTAQPDRARAALLGIRGVGPWTADAYMLSALRLPDVFPVGDRALQVGVGEVIGMSGPASPAELEVLSMPWRPIRAAAARIVWHHYLASRGRSEPPDPTAPPPPAPDA